MQDTQSEFFWRREASRVRRRINLGWWLERLNWLLLPGFLILAAFVIWTRAAEKDWFNSGFLLSVAAGVVLLSALLAWILGRRRFMTEGAALIRLDDRWALNSRLAAAAEGKASWPPPKLLDRAEVIPRWRGTTALLPAGVAMVLVALAWLVPLPVAEPAPRGITSEPRAWEQIEEWIETLDPTGLIEPASLEEIAEQIEELRDQPDEEWFSHSSLEASDNLKDSFGRNLQEMGQDLAAIERSLEALEAFSTELSAEGRELLMRELSDALEGLAANGLTLNEALAEQLSQLDPSSLSKASVEGLSAEQLRQLQEQLGEGTQTLGSLEGLEPLPGEEGGQLAEIPATMPGSGGVQRGRGDAPIFFGDPDDLKTNRIEAVSNADLSRAAMGDVIGVGEAEHEKDMTATGIQDGGAVESAGTGGDAVWKDALLPDEQAVLKRYFK